MSTNSVRDKRLYSVRISEISDAMYELGGRKELPPDDQEIAQLLLLLRHSDAEVRELAVNTAGVRWRLKEAYPILKNMAVYEEKDQSVLTTICAALGALAMNAIGDLSEVNKILSLIVLNTNLDPLLRGKAYIELQAISNKIDVQKFAISSRDIEKLDFDKEWVKSLL